MGLTIQKEEPKQIYYKKLSDGSYYGPYTKWPKINAGESVLTYDLTLASIVNKKEPKKKPKKEYYKTPIEYCEHPLHNREKGNRCGNCGWFLPLI